MFTDEQCFTETSDSAAVKLDAPTPTTDCPREGNGGAVETIPPNIFDLPPQKQLAEYFRKQKPVW